MVEQIPAPIPSALQHQSLASPAIPVPTTASADFTLRFAPLPFQARGEISSGKNALLPCTTAGSTPLRIDHKSFAVSCPLALLSSAFYPILFIGSQFRSTLPLHGRSPFRSCASLHSQWSARGGTCTHKSALMLSAHEKKGCHFMTPL